MSDDSMLRGVQHHQSTLSQLGSFVSAPTSTVSFYIRPQVGVDSINPTNALASSRAPSIKVYGWESRLVPSIFYDSIVSGLQANHYSHTVFNGIGPQPSITPTNSWVALLLAIIHAESSFGAGDSYGPKPYPAPGSWYVNHANCVGPMQVMLNSNYSNEVAQDVRLNIHAGINHFWRYGNWRFGNSITKRMGEFRLAEMSNTVEWALRAYNGGPSSRYIDSSTSQMAKYQEKIVKTLYPYYLAQLQASSVNMEPTAIQSGLVPEHGELAIPPKLLGPATVPETSVSNWSATIKKIRNSAPGDAKEPTGCVRMARHILSNVYQVAGKELGSVSSEIIPRGVSFTATSSKKAPGANDIGRVVEARMKSAGGVLPNGWYVVNPPSALKTGIAWTKGSSAYGHIQWVVDGLIYDNHSAGGKIGGTRVPYFAISHPMFGDQSAPVTTEPEPGTNYFREVIYDDAPTIVRPFESRRRR